MATWARSERAALVERMRDLGPTAPTLCEGWATADMAAHLYVRERRPDAGPGVLLGGPLATHTDRVMASVLRVHSYDYLLDRIAAGPPLLWRPLDEAVNHFEFFVHHEDVRRANGDDVRDLPDAQEWVLWARLNRMLRLSFRRLKGVRVEVVAGPGRQGGVGSGAPVRLEGPVGELVLYAFNRKGAARVEVSGDDTAIERLRAARLGV